MLTQPSLLDLAKLLTAHHPTSSPRSTSLFLLAFSKPHPKAMPTPSPIFPCLPHGGLSYSLKKVYHSFPLKLTHALHDSIYQSLYQVTCSTNPKHPSPPLQVSFTNLNMLPAPTASGLYIPLIIGLPNTLHEVPPIPHKRLP